MVERTFSPTDQTAFARLSGDHNPIHMDEIAARRLLFGAPVVHGVHALLWCMDALCPVSDEKGLDLLAVKAVFGRPIVVNEDVAIEQTASRHTEHAAFEVRAKLLVNGAAVASVSAKYRPRTVESKQPENSFPEQLPSQAIDDAQLIASSGSLPLHLPVAAAADLFPNLVRCLPAVQLAVLLATTRLVGVHCPGLDSVFSELSLAWTDNAAEHLRFRVCDFDERFALATIDIVAPQMTGQLGAFRRPAVRQQQGYADFLELVGPREFVGCRALLVGGSRGLGEVAAKILCAGGADVRLTYHRGAQDANSIVADITAHGGCVSAWQYDIADPGLPEGSVLAGERIPTHVLYFATPHIFAGTKGVFSPRLFNRFCDYFVIAFSRIFAQLNALGTRNYFLPSSSAIDEMPPDMAEYVAAKAAAEHAAQILEKANKGVVIAQPRLPRLATDQTVTIAGSDDGDPVPVLLEALRGFIRTGG
jgi:acyl dehydratase